MLSCNDTYPRWPSCPIELTAPHFRKKTFIGQLLVFSKESLVNTRPHNILHVEYDPTRDLIPFGTCTSIISPPGQEPREALSAKHEPSYHVSVAADRESGTQPTNKLSNLVVRQHILARYFTVIICARQMSCGRV